MSTSIQVRIWDLPTRLFHWTLLFGCIICWATATQFNDAMRWHFLAGYVTLAVLVFRVLWGIFGSSTARFSSFLSQLREIKTYLATFHYRQPSYTVGHSPLGGLATLALIITSLTVSITGLFANDAVMTKGPLAHWVSDNSSDSLTDLHQISFNILLSLVILHLIAIAYYRVVKRENLLRPMLTGHKKLPNHPSSISFVSNRIALIVLLLCSVLVGWIATR